MGFFGFVFWMFVIWMIAKHWHRREGRRMIGPNGYAPNTGWYDSGEFYNPRGRVLKKKNREPENDQQIYIESLETRVSELEARLDFTERLLSERRDSVSS